MRVYRRRTPPKEPDPALGRSQVGCDTKVHRVSDRRGHPLCLRLTGGQRPDRTQTRDLGAAWTAAALSCPLADWAYDGDAFRSGLAQRGLQAVIPTRS